jgi:glyoxylase-like metal-dependent hydrolase (beta-lactamase superfamily II)
MIHEILPVGVLQCNCSIFGDEASREAIVIDPGADLADIETILQKHQLTVKAIVVTHAHIDHVAGAQELKEKTGAPVYLNANDQELLSVLDIQAQWIGVPAPGKIEVDTNASDGTSLSLGGSDFHVMHTPGHTQGSISIFIPQQNMLIAGDTLFRDSIGRTDLPGGNGRQILSSIKTRLLVLPEETVVVPGHGPKTTLGREKEKNPFLQNL